jgi:hypothetical protein
MFMHSLCKNSIYLNLSDSIVLLASFGPAKTGLKIGQGDIIYTEDKIEPKFFCPQCNKGIPIEEIEGVCSHCGDLFKIRDLFRVLDSGGIYCSECVKLLPDDPVRPLITIFSKVLTTGL